MYFATGFGRANRQHAVFVGFSKPTNPMIGVVGRSDLMFGWLFPDLSLCPRRQGVGRRAACNGSTRSSTTMPSTADSWCCQLRTSSPTATMGPAKRPHSTGPRLSLHGCRSRAGRFEVRLDASKIWLVNEEDGQISLTLREPTKRASGSSSSASTKPAWMTLLVWSATMPRPCPCPRRTRRKSGHERGVRQ